MEILAQCGVPVESFTKCPRLSVLNNQQKQAKATKKLSLVSAASPATTHVFLASPHCKELK
jgi:hypothetical protein